MHFPLHWPYLTGFDSDQCRLARYTATNQKCQQPDASKLSIVIVLGRHQQIRSASWRRTNNSGFLHSFSCDRFPRMIHVERDFINSVTPSYLTCRNRSSSGYRFHIFINGLESMRTNQPHTPTSCLQRFTHRPSLLSQSIRSQSSPMSLPELHLRRLPHTHQEILVDFPNLCLPLSTPRPE